jgi:hypothetical protein
MWRSVLLYVTISDAKTLPFATALLDHWPCFVSSTILGRYHMGRVVSTTNTQLMTYPNQTVIAVIKLLSKLFQLRGRYPWYWKPMLCTKGVKLLSATATVHVLYLYPVISTLTLRGIDTWTKPHQWKEPENYCVLTLPLSNKSQC